jgi:phage FluMu protein Com
MCRQARPSSLLEWRCPACQKLLLRLWCSQGSQIKIETRCPKCGAIVVKEQAV